MLHRNSCRFVTAGLQGDAMLPLAGSIGNCEIAQLA
jgi:hypothetical protein